MKALGESRISGNDFEIQIHIGALIVNTSTSCLYNISNSGHSKDQGGIQQPRGEGDVFTSLKTRTYISK